ncbi:hypothetical protein HY733_01145 [Candidatus Uhrbacteria bacterium]|nr:hypothetical protein [Candidatus Uhrbacteria bacterium]
MNLEAPSNPQEEQQQVWQAHTRDFARRLVETLSEEEKMEIDRTAGERGFVEDALTFSLKNPERYKNELVDLVRNLALVSGGKQLGDPIRGGGLGVDQQGNLVIIRSQEFGLDFENEAKVAHGESTYEVLTGPDTGKQYTTRTHPLWSSSVERVIEE